MFLDHTVNQLIKDSELLAKYLKELSENPNRLARVNFKDEVKRQVLIQQMNTVNACVKIYEQYTKQDNPVLDSLRAAAKLLEEAYKKS